jgi:hypothetical protein
MLMLSQLQEKEGIDAVIVDTVLAIRKELTNNQDAVELEKAARNIVERRNGLLETSGNGESVAEI